MTFAPPFDSGDASEQVGFSDEAGDYSVDRCDVCDQDLRIGGSDCCPRCECFVHCCCLLQCASCHEIECKLCAPMHHCSFSPDESIGSCDERGLGKDSLRRILSSRHWRSVTCVAFGCLGNVVSDALGAERLVALPA